MNGVGWDYHAQGCFNLVLVPFLRLLKMQIVNTETAMDNIALRKHLHNLLKLRMDLLLQLGFQRCFE